MNSNGKFADRIIDERLKNMARKNNNSNSDCWHSKKMMSIGLLLVIAGIVYNMSQKWDYVFIAVGALVFLKGLALKFMKQ